MLHHGSRKWRDERRERAKGVENERRREEGRGREGGREGERAGQWLVDILPGPKPQTDREREGGGGWERTRVEARKENLFISEGLLLLISSSFQISLSGVFKEHASS